MNSKNIFSKKKIALLSSLFFIPLLFSATPIPKLSGYVTDNAKILSAQDASKITQFLQSVESQTGIQIAVLTVPSLQGETIESFSIRTADSWKLGQKDADTGVLFVVSMQERSMRIEVGYGLEGKLTDIKTGAIIRSVITPAFQNSHYAQGIYEGVQNIAGVASDNAEFISRPVQNAPQQQASEKSVEAIISLLIMLLFLFGRFGFFFFPFSFFGRSHYRGGGFHGGGGFGGGGFSGGGGGFGGGGASGRW
ncbi:MAG: TPM domain-containing protein [Treponemataceae bacterium]